VVYGVLAQIARRPEQAVTVGLAVHIVVFPDKLVVMAAMAVQANTMLAVAVAVALEDTPVLAALVVLGIVMVGKQALEAVAEAVVVLEPIHNQITLVAV